MTIQTIDRKMINEISSPAYCTDIYRVCSHMSGRWSNVRCDYFIATSRQKAEKYFNQVYKNRTVLDVAVCDVNAVTEMIANPERYPIIVFDDGGLFDDCQNQEAAS